MGDGMSDKSERWLSFHINTEQVKMVFKPAVERELRKKWSGTTVIGRDKTKRKQKQALSSRVYEKW